MALAGVVTTTGIDAAERQQTLAGQVQDGPTHPLRPLNPMQPTPPFPTLIPTEPLPTLPPSVPTPAPYTPTATLVPEATPSPTAVTVTPSPPPPSLTPVLSPTATSYLGLSDTIWLPFVALFHDFDAFGLSTPEPQTAPTGAPLR